MTERKNMKDFIQKTIEDLLKTMSFEGRVTTEEGGDGGTRFNIETDDAPLLIGQGGENLLALQQIVKKIIEKKVEGGRGISFLIDVNGYRRHRINLLEELAHSAAKKVMTEGRPTILQAMNSFERRIVHSVVSNYTDLSTESHGEEPDRRIVIKSASII